MMAVVQNYNVGGWIDEIKKINLPPHLFPKLHRPFTKGLRIEMPAIEGVYSITYTLEEDMELINVSLVCSGYKDTDEWEVVTQAPNEEEYKVVETMPTRELAESINMGNILYVIHRLPKGSTVRFDFYNHSGTSKTVWPSLRFLR